MKTYYVYFLASLSRRLYVGITSDLAKRVHEHKRKLRPGFTAEYNIDRLVYFESTFDVRAAIAREKELKDVAPREKARAHRNRQPHVGRSLPLHRR